MAFRQVGKFATSAISQRYFSRMLVVRAFSANDGPRERIWNCSKEAPGEIHLECLKDMLVDGDIQLFDVRETDEVASTGKIPLSINIPCKFFSVLLHYLPASIIIIVVELIRSFCPLQVVEILGSFLSHGRQPEVSSFPIYLVFRLPHLYCY